MPSGHAGCLECILTCVDWRNSLLIHQLGLSSASLGLRLILRAIRGGLDAKPKERPCGKGKLGR
jgi:hypothetical protein